MTQNIAVVSLIKMHKKEKKVSTKLQRIFIDEHSIVETFKKRRAIYKKCLKQIKKMFNYLKKQRQEFMNQIILDAKA